MKYMILMYGSQRDYDLLTGKATDGLALSPEEFAPMHAFMESFTAELVGSGEFVDAQSLAAPVLSRRIQLQRGVPVVTDGPYAETQEVLSGYWIVECESFDRATEITAKLANCPSPGDVFANSVADVRPIDTADCVEPDRPAVRLRHRGPSCAIWRRRSLARSCGGTGTSPWPRTRSKKRSLPRSPSGPTKAYPRIRAVGSSPSPLAG